MPSFSRWAAVCALAVMTLAAPAVAEAGGVIVVERGKGPQTVSFTAASAGEAIVHVSAAAGRVDWGEVGAESAVVSAWVDGEYASDLVVVSSSLTERSFALGDVSAGKHVLELRFASDRSPAGARKVRLKGLSVAVVRPSDPLYTALRHAPVLYGRSIPVTNTEGSGTSYSGPFQNAVTDTPLLAWHESASSTVPGHRLLEYSVVWSNEDGGTNSPALMARWGRTTDIEWIYRVQVDAAGSRVPGTAFYQGPDHVTTPFAGTYEGDHPVLQTCTNNNMVCPALVEAGMRFFLSADATRPPDRAREVLMDANPWTYPVMAAEMVREGRIESPSSPATPALGDQRTYLYLELDKETTPPNPPGPSWIGVAVGVRLNGDPTVYRSDHAVPDWSINRDVPAATTVELPAGTTPGDVSEVIAYRVVVGTDTGSSATVMEVNRAFFLDDEYLPMPSFIDWSGSVALTAAQPSGRLWPAGP
jgi:hypothetical protein